MTNFQVYKKILSFSLLIFLFDMLGLLIVAGMASAGYFIFNQSTDKALIGLGIGLVIGITIVVLLSIFVTNRIKAAQISMMTLGVTEGKMPENTFHAGFESVKGRFGKITGFFAVTWAIKAVFRQIGRGLNKVGRAVGGDVGEGITSAIDSAIQIVIGYLCDCCLGWVLYRKEVGTFKAGCEGAAIFFKHGKTLIRNIGRIFGMGILSFVVIGGAFFGIFYLIFTQFPAMFNSLSHEIIEIGIRTEAEIPEWVTNPQYLTLFVCGILAIIIWSCIHQVLIRPFILVGVMRNFMAAGIKDMPTEEDFVTLENKFPKFSRLRTQA